MDTITRRPNSAISRAIFTGVFIISLILLRFNAATAQGAISIEVEVLLNGTNVLKITDVNKKLIFTYQTDNLIIPDLVKISPDKQFVAFVEVSGSEVNHVSRIKLINLLENSVLDFVLPAEQHYPTNPVWSPDSDKIAYVWLSQSETDAELWVADITSGKQTKLNTANIFNPILIFGKTESISWNQQDGDYILYHDESLKEYFEISLDENVLPKIISSGQSNDFASPNYSGMVRPVPVRNYDETCFDGYTGLYPDYGGCVLSGPHPAVDIADSDAGGQTPVIGCGTPVVAACDGQVELVRTPTNVAPNGVCGDNSGSYTWPDHLGYFVLIRCDNIPDASLGGVTYGGTIYITHAHLSQVDVTSGSGVVKGQQIGLVGSTGNSSGPHLHYQMEKDNHSNIPGWWNTESQILTYTWNPMYFIQAHESGSCCGCGTNSMQTQPSWVSSMAFPTAYGPETPVPVAEENSPPVEPTPLPEVAASPPPVLAEEQPPAPAPLPPDVTAPSVQLTIGSGTGIISTLYAPLHIQARDDRSVTQMRFSADRKFWSDWEPYTPWRTWPFTTVPGMQAVYVQVQDAAGNISAPAQALTRVNLDVARPASASYTLARSVVGMSGGEKISASYTVHGTGGQPYETGHLQSSGYQVFSGFWSGITTLPGTWQIYLPLTLR